MTLQELISTHLTPEEQRLFIHNLGMRTPRNPNGRTDILCEEWDTTCCFVSGCFSWSQTPEGVSYWNRLSERVNLRPYQLVSTDTMTGTIDTTKEPIYFMSKHKFV